MIFINMIRLKEILNEATWPKGSEQIMYKPFNYYHDRDNTKLARALIINGVWIDAKTKRIYVRTVDNKAKDPGIHEYQMLEYSCDKDCFITSKYPTSYLYNRKLQDIIMKLWCFK